MKLIIDIPEDMYEDIKNGYYNTTGMRKIAITIGNGTPIPDNATVCDIEQIRGEIERLHYHPKLDFIKNDEVVEMALDIIGKYTKGEQGC